MEESAARKVGVKAFAIACVGGLLAAVVGQNTLAAWGISPPALHLTAGLVLLLVALRAVLAQYGPVGQGSPSAPAPANLAFSPLAFPTILTPYGLATFILILAVTREQGRELIIILLFGAVMVLNLLVMRYARTIIRRGALGLQLLGAILGILQVALALQMILDVLRALRVLAPPGP
jgi:multiple antibiotic resistance protein